MFWSPEEEIQERTDVCLKTHGAQVLEIPHTARLCFSRALRGFLDWFTLHLFRIRKLEGRWNQDLPADQVSFQLLCTDWSVHRWCKIAKNVRDSVQHN